MIADSHSDVVTKGFASLMARFLEDPIARENVDAPVCCVIEGGDPRVFIFRPPLEEGGKARADELLGSERVGVPSPGMSRIHGSAQVWADLFQGRRNPQAAFVSGHLKVSGRPGPLIHFSSLIAPGSLSREG